jgi:ABC-type oligopeptide transport system substrate-binding subunit
MVEKHGPAWSEARHIVTNGPFLLEAWQPNQSLASSRNPGYRGRFGGNVQRIEVSVIGSDDALELYDLDRLDVAEVAFVAEFDEVRRRHAAEYMTAPLASPQYIKFDLTRAPFDDVRVRRAFAQAIDRDTLTNRTLSGRLAPGTGGFVPPGIPGHSAAIGLAFDPEQARQALSEAGYPNGMNFPQVDLLANSTHWTLIVEDLLQQWLANLGVKVNGRVAASGEEYDRLRLSGRVEIHASGELADYPDADSLLRVFVANQTEWRNAAFDQMVEAATQVSNLAERTALYQAADRILIEDAPVVPVAYGRYHMLVKPWIRHYHLSPMRSVPWKDVVIEPH